MTLLENYCILFQPEIFLIIRNGVFSCFPEDTVLKEAKDTTKMVFSLHI